MTSGCMLLIFGARLPMRRRLLWWGILTKEEEARITEGLTAVDKEWEDGVVGVHMFQRLDYYD